MKYMKTFEKFDTPKCALSYKKGEEIVFIKDYDDKLRRGTTFKILNVDGDTLTIEDKESNIKAHITFDGEVENCFKKCNPYNDTIDSDILN